MPKVNYLCTASNYNFLPQQMDIYTYKIDFINVIHLLSETQVKPTLSTSL